MRGKLEVRGQFRRWGSIQRLGVNLEVRGQLVLDNFTSITEYVELEPRGKQWI